MVKKMLYHKMQWVTNTFGFFAKDEINIAVDSNCALNNSVFTVNTY